MPNLHFSVDAWSAWSSELNCSNDWVNWANQINSVISQIPLDVSKIPSMQRRRMSQLTKMAISNALTCHQHLSSTPNCVFASQHGELTRTMKILQSLVLREDVSPTDFSLSVHNSALGLYSIQTNNKQVATTVAAGKNTFGFALLEATILLNRFPDTPVLLVYFDEQVPPPLPQTYHPANAICVALVLSASGKQSININLQSGASNTDEFTACQATEFMRFFLSERNSLQLGCERYHWYWNKN